MKQIKTVWPVKSHRPRGDSSPLPPLLLWFSNSAFSPVLMVYWMLAEHHMRCCLVFGKSEKTREIKHKQKKAPEISLILKFSVAFIFSDLHFENVFWPIYLSIYLFTAGDWTLKIKEIWIHWNRADGTLATVQDSSWDTCFGIRYPERCPPTQLFTSYKNRGNLQDILMLIFLSCHISQRSLEKQQR